MVNFEREPKTVRRCSDDAELWRAAFAWQDLSTL
jgi:hypothetical protein